MLKTLLKSLSAAPGAGALSPGMQALEAQRALLPYALMFFAVGLPIFLWAGAHAAEPLWMLALLAQFGVNWGVFYLALAWLKRAPDADRDERLRFYLQTGGFVLWSLSIVAMTAFAADAGAAREGLLLLTAAAAVSLLFFAAPVLPSLLLAGPIAVLPPLALLIASGHDAPVTKAACGGAALAMALCLILNRALRTQFGLAAERESLIAERDRSLDEARRLAKSKSDILATLSHEVRNGLTGVADVLASATSQPRMGVSREQLSAALDASRELLDVLDATFDNEIASSGRLTVDRRPFDITRLARQMVLLHGPAAAAKGLELTVQDSGVDDAGGAVIGDPARVRQILGHLVGNAVKYTPRGRVEVRINPVSPTRLRVDVVDTGPGLSPDEIETAFTPFSRVERTGAGVGGAGLGLSLSRDLARLMDGDVGAECAVGVGSRFWLELPYDAAATPAAEGAGSSRPSRDRRAQRILLVHDDDLAAATLRGTLEQLGHQVVAARDGARALELAGVCDFDLLMLDGRNAAFVADAESHALPPIIGVIDGAPEEAEACLSAGAVEVIRRPATVAAVARALAAVQGSTSPAMRMVNAA